MVALIAAPVCDAIRLGSIGTVFNNDMQSEAPTNFSQVNVADDDDDIPDYAQLAREYEDWRLAQDAR